MKNKYMLAFIILISSSSTYQNIKANVKASSIKDTTQTKRLKAAILNYKINPNLEHINQLIISFNNVTNRPLARAILRSYKIDLSNLNMLLDQERLGAQSERLDETLKQNKSKQQLIKRDKIDDDELRKIRENLKPVPEEKRRQKIDFHKKTESENIAKLKKIKEGLKSN